MDYYFPCRARTPDLKWLPPMLPGTSALGNDPSDGSGLPGRVWGPKITALTRAHNLLDKMRTLFTNCQSTIYITFQHKRFKRLRKLRSFKKLRGLRAQGLISLVQGAQKIMSAAQRAQGAQIRPGPRRSLKTLEALREPRKALGTPG